MIVFIDADNINSTYYIPLKTHLIENYNCNLEVYLFGNIRNRHLSDWDELIESEGIIVDLAAPGKNSSDMKLINLLYSKYYGDNIKDFCIVSSDSDFQYTLKSLPKEANILLAYSRHKVSQSYLTLVNKLGLGLIDLESIRGPLTDEGVYNVINTVLTSYLEYKLSEEFFSYSALAKWIEVRFPELKDFPVNELHKYCEDKLLTFSKDGITVVNKQLQVIV